VCPALWIKSSNSHRSIAPTSLPPKIPSHWQHLTVAVLRPIFLRMILDSLAQWQRYASLGPRFEKAFAYLREANAGIPVGRVDIDGDDLFAVASKYSTKSVDLCRFEAHRLYADIQLILTGRERMLWAPLSSLSEVIQPYDPGKDILFFGSPPTSFTSLVMSAGQFAIFFPEDGHAPCIELGGCDYVTKIVVKVRV
jgi:biofilm protein TabA